MSVDEVLLGRFRGTLFATIAPAMVAAALIGAIIAAILLAPLRRMAREAEGIGAGAIDARLSLQKEADEVGNVGRAFNGALERLQHAHEGLRRYADNIAHEIRTPLNRILMRAEIAAREPRTEVEYREIIEAQARECSALASLAQRLLFLARAENTPVPLERTELDLQTECGVLQSYFEAGAADAGVGLSVDCPSSECAIPADRPLFQQAIGNLLDNALAHTPRGGAVRVVVRVESANVELAVIDSGIGIAPEELPHVFDRFYRGGGRRTPKDDGVGLGLAIARSILELHGGSITIESELGVGTAVRTRWPRA
jgi:two-component system heavy metal sensor histidine kinase CusS